jgi:hypothetical protein
MQPKLLGKAINLPRFLFNLKGFYNNRNTKRYIGDFGKDYSSTLAFRT